MSEAIQMIVEGLVVVGCIFMGVRGGGIALGIFGGMGTAVLVFVFGLPPGSPPVDALLIILSVVLAASAMEAAGGIRWLVSVATRIIRAHPSRVTIVAPLVSFAFSMGAGTSNIFYPLIPVIYETAYENGIRPERPLSASVVAASSGVVCSPVSAAMAVMITLVGTEQYGLELPQILAIVVPASLLGVLACSVAVRRRGKELTDDPEVQRRIAEGELARPQGTAATEADPLAPLGRPSALIFLGGIGFVVLVGLFDGLRPQIPTADGGSEPVSMSTVIQMVMLTVAVLIVVLRKVKPADLAKQDVFSAGITALIALFGVAWLADTYVSAHLELITSTLSEAVEDHPITFALALAIVAALTTSQSAATKAIVPIGLAIGLPATAVTGMWVACGATVILPTTGPQIASVQFDHTGTTRIGQAVINHSFLFPMLVYCAVAIPAGLAISQVVPF